MTKPFSVLLLRPDYLAGAYGQDTYFAHVEGEDVVAAIAAARAEVFEIDHANHQLNRVESYAGEDPTDYLVLFAAEGHIQDINPED